MASITQTIPSFTGGISQQPDELILPGQVKDLVNSIPDITDGLVKRPGCRYLGALSGATSTGSWFSYYRDETEGAYIGQIQLNGDVNIWSATDGSAQSFVSSQSNAGYFVHSAGTPIRFLSIADTTFVTNTGSVINMTGTSSQRGVRVHGGTDNRNYQAFVELRQLSHGREYSFDVHTANATKENLHGSGNDDRGKALALHVTIDSNTFSGRQITRGDNPTYQGLNPDCGGVGSKVFVVDSANDTGKNLAFRLTTTAQVAISEDAPASATRSTDYVAVYNTTVELLNGGYGWKMHNDGDTLNSSNSVTVTMRGDTYKVAITEVQPIKTQKDLGTFRPQPTSFDANNSISADGILAQVESASLTVDAERIGNGVFLSHSSPFVVSTMQPDLWRITSTEINDPTTLPRQCKNGFTVKVSNSQESTEDDYFLEFKATGGNGGPGQWEETVEPGLTDTHLNGGSMPHKIVRRSDGQFEIQSTAWTGRLVGDDITNPKPSFVGETLQQTFLHRNRLGFLSKNNVILSRAGDITNFFVDTALVIGNNDPIDIEASSTEPTTFKEAIETNTGLVIFGETQQFLLHTDSDALTPETGKLSNISTYRYSPDTKPINLGTTLGFVDNAGQHARFFEMFDIRREGEPQIIEQTKVAQRLLPNDLDLLAISRENNMIFFGKSGANNSTIFGHRYYNSGDKRLQSAWFKWSFPFDIEYYFVLDDQLLIVERTNKALLSVPLRKADAERQVPGQDYYGDDTTYNVHLDSSKTETAGSYDPATNLTTVTWTNKAGSGTAAAVNATTGEVYVQHSVSGNDYKFVGNFSGASVIIGWLFTMQVDMPRIFVKKTAGERTTSDMSASLTLHRAHLRFGPVGQFDVALKRRGKPDVTSALTYDQTQMDWYEAGDAPFVSERSQAVPVYERNINCNITLKSTHPGPATFHSMTWEGDYTPMYYKRV